MDNSDSAPDSWEQADIDAQEAQLNSSLAQLNVNAKPFIPNVHAAEFVPSFQVKSSTAVDGLQDEDATHNSAQESSQSSEGSNAATGMDISEPVENGETEMSPEECWDHKDEPNEAEPGGGFSGDGGSAEEVAQEMEEEEEITKPKTVVAPPDAPKKEHVNVVFIGHVDAGKSTIGGQIMYLTGMVDKRTLEKYEREAKEKNRETWYLSWALDTNQEERDKGKTVEVGRAYFETEKKHFTILDAPGHKSFVPNMIGGASQADLAVLVISARKGEFETGFEKGGQTREHAMLAKTAGVKHLIVLINKMDDPTVNWSIDSGLPFIPYLDNLPHFNRSLDGPVRLPIVDKYKDMGTVVLGKLESGSICKGQQLAMMPNKHNVEVLGILSDEVETELVAPGENLKIRLKGIEEEEILPGFILCDPNNLCHSGRTFDAQIVIIEHKSIICPGYNAVLHIHTCIEEVEITALICLVDKKTGEKSKTRPRFVKQDQVCIARLRTAGTICLETFKDFPQMGRFTLRDEGKTIAIGKVLKLVPEKD
ncbi:eukaryotic peptide chain release factor GTP-binding subunit ERF3A isoform X4 [Rana temporaria]|uniref:eukaryotic peptide chain release factor GTP-binding subunit ERF3A isoform X4 n=1 Tax=Rana temporaria TaxID=8407 RepID=UPI001AACC0E8|nr:eukaryotic peptide chain release factor GTP-binding subunit ERF3A isoform X4 [Rana temporaria]